MRPVIRAVTGFISTAEFSALEQYIKRWRQLRERFEAAGYRVQTLRVTTDILDGDDPSDALKRHGAMVTTLNEHPDVTLFHLGSPAGGGWISAKSEERLVEAILAHHRAYVAVNTGETRPNRDACAAGARICRAVAEASSFECRRFGVHAHVTQSTPFYPASRVMGNSGTFALGLQCANLAVEEAHRAQSDLSRFEEQLRARLEQEFQEVASCLPARDGNGFLGFDTSLAPFPAREHSIAHAVEVALQKPFGSSGTLALAALLTRVMQENTIPRTGLCGLMLPVVEDNILARRGIEGVYTLRELMLCASVCATGLDAIPLAGNTSLRDLADCYLDLATMAVRLKKPLSARFFFELGKNSGETVRYPWSFACESPVMDL